MDETPTTSKCKKCSRVLPLDREHFTQSKPGYWRRVCKDCQYAAQRKWASTVIGEDICNQCGGKFARRRATDARRKMAGLCPECARGHRKTHGRCRDARYQGWHAMIHRCVGGRRPDPDYAGRGISVCDEWRDFSAFLKWSDENGWSPGLSLDRIDPSGNYSPDNCRWVTRVEQSYNRRNSVIIEAWGERKTLGTWVRDPRCTVCATTIRKRLLEGGWDGERLLSFRQSHKPEARKRKGDWFYGARDMDLVECLTHRGYDCSGIVRQINARIGAV